MRRFRGTHGIDADVVFVVRRLDTVVHRPDTVVHRLDTDGHWAW